MNAPVVLVLGAGPNIGQNAVTLFTARGYRVATVSRTKQNFVDTEDTLHLQADLSDMKTVPAVFEQLRRVWGIPSVIIYNAYALTFLSGKDPFASFSLDQFTHDIAINVNSAIIAASCAVEGFKALPPSTRKTFIYTGNKLNMMPSPKVMYFGMGKTAVAHMIWDCSVAYGDQGFKFYYTDERFADGKPAREFMSGQARAEMCLRLVEEPKQQQWHHTFVKDKGYINFAEVDRQAVLNNKFE